MLWDRIHVIVPFEDFVPSYASAEAAESFNLIGKCHYPSPAEKKQAHDLVEDFATKGLPESFSYVSVTSPEEIYEVYPQKLLPKTWDLLQQAGLAGRPLLNADYRLASATGLSVMSLLADCCAGDSLVRVTDRPAAYASLAGLLTQKTESLATAETRESLLALTLNVADATSIPLAKWIKFRKREEGGSDGHHIRDLRHRFVQHIETQAKKMAAAKSDAELTEVKMQFKDDTHDDYAALREALELEAWQMLPTKEVIISVLGGIAALGGVAFNTVMPMTDVVTRSGAVATIGGLLASRSKFVNARRRVLREHPISYLYEAGGRLRL